MNKELIKIMLCGDVDSGKSTFLAEFLIENGGIPADQINSGIVRNNEITSLLDGLRAEQEQKITIDVAYRYFETDDKRFSLADAPGHVEFTKNMAVAASSSDIAIVVVDAVKGISEQTKRHLAICYLFDIRSYIFVVNKMDLVNYDNEIYAALFIQISQVMNQYEQVDIYVIPVSAINGENILNRSKRMLWYKGETFSKILTSITITKKQYFQSEFLFPVQRVQLLKNDRRQLQGILSRGTLCLGDNVRILPGTEVSSIRELSIGGRMVDKVTEGYAAEVVLEDNVNAPRGCSLVNVTESFCTRLFEADLLWIGEDVLTEGRVFFFRFANKTASGTIKKINKIYDLSKNEKKEDPFANRNQIVNVLIMLDDEIYCERFVDSHLMGGFIAISRRTLATVGCGMIRSYPNQSLSSRESDNTSFTIWFTGLSGSGKSTLAKACVNRLQSFGQPTVLLDGDDIRKGLCNNLGFGPEDRKENIRRVAEVCKLFNRNGIVAVAALISPAGGDRMQAKEIIGSDSFYEIHVSTPLEVCERRDAKGLYKKAREGKIKDFTGISSPYEEPNAPFLRINTEEQDVDSSIEFILSKVSKKRNDDSV
ncbi:MAG: adenylyl-sulfate kinase [Lachnospiraceae bacterium]|nr:adenylyl-sulfate kinase [Lachnospiraceae bacterium]